jgi:PAS domain S-box-containing protein
VDKAMVSKSITSSALKLSKYQWPTLVSWLATLALIVISVDGLKEWLRPDQHGFRFFIVLLLIFFFAAVALWSERFARRLLSSDMAMAHERLHLAMACGRSVGWDFDLKMERNVWFGDLQTIFGVASDTCSGPAQDFYRYIHPGDRERVSEALTNARVERVPYDGEFRIVRTDGTVRWLSASGKFYYGKNGAPERMLGMAVDVTDKKHAYEALIQSEEKFSKAFRESPMGLTIIRLRDQVYLEVNETFERLTGWMREEVIGKSSVEVGVGVSPRERQELITRVSAEGRVRDLELRYRSKNGEERVGLGSAELMDVKGEKCLLSAIIDITDRKRAEEALRRAEAELKEAQQLAQLGSWQWDPKSLAVTWSKELYLIHGLDPQLPPPSWDELSRHFTPASWKRLRDILIEARQSGRVRDADLELIRPDGTRRWVTVRGQAVRNDAGELVCIRGTTQDITERRQAEDAVRGSEARFRRVVEHITEALMVDDAAGHIVFANDRFLQLFGFKREELEHISLQDYVAPDYRSQMQSRRQRWMKGEKVEYPVHYECVRRDGTRFWVELEAVPILDQKGKFGGTQKLLRDISERKRVEQALRESEERFRLVANTAPVLLWMSGTDKGCTYFNKAWLDFTGRPLEAEVGNGWAAGVHPEDLDNCLNTYNSAFERRESFRMEYRLRRHDGEYRWILDIGVPRFNRDGSFAGYIDSGIDLTETKLAQEALASMGRRLIEAHEEERTWIGRELHDDINQRLALLAVELDRWRQQRPFDAGVGEQVVGAQRRIAEIAKDVQALSHRLHSSKLDYLGLAAAASSFCREFSEQTETQVHFKHSGIPASLPREVSLCFFRVLQEALQNAAKHSGVRAFNVELVGGTGGIELKVSDRGVGFNQRDVIRQRGLGLISMRERVQLVKGEFSIDSRPGAGTIVRVYVRTKPAEYEAAAS